MDDDLEYSNQGKAAQDLFVSDYATHIFYVEDSNSEIFFERLFQRLFPKLASFEVVCLHGKDNVRNKASEPRLGSLSYVFVVDKDFDDLLGAPDNRLTYLDRYSIENYLTDLDAIIKVLVEEHPQGATAQRVRADCSDYDDFRSALEDRLVEVTRYFVVVRRHWLELPSTKIKFEELTYGSNEWHPMPTREWVASYRGRVLSESGMIEADLDMELAGALVPSADFHGATENPIHHVPGKHLLPSVIRYLGIRTGLELEKRLGKSLYTRILNHVNFDHFAIFKERLLFQHPELVECQ